MAQLSNIKHDGELFRISHEIKESDGEMTRMVSSEIEKRKLVAFDGQERK